MARRFDAGYYFSEGFHSIFTHGFMSFAAVCMIVACLLIMGSFSLVAVNLNDMLGDLEDENQLAVYIDDSYTEEQARALEEELKAVPNVTNMTFVTRAEALDTYQQSHNNVELFEDLPDDVRVMVKKLPDSFLEHATYRIRMDVNPCRCVDGRHQAVPRGELENWLHDKAKRSGFAFTHLQIGRYGATRFTKEGHRVTFAELRVDGIVRVLDADLFKQTVANGFGRGKAFGYGLMQIIPISLQ